MSARTTPMPADWHTPDGMKIAILAGMGISTKGIVENVGVTPCQVTYRLHKWRIKRNDYRNLKSPLAQQMARRMFTTRRAAVKMLDLP